MGTPYVVVASCTCRCASWSSRRRCVLFVFCFNTSVRRRASWSSWQHRTLSLRPGPSSLRWEHHVVVVRLGPHGNVHRRCVLVVRTSSLCVLVLMAPYVVVVRLGLATPYVGPGPSSLRWEHHVVVAFWSSRDVVVRPGPSSLRVLVLMGTRAVFESPPASRAAVPSSGQSSPLYC